MNTMNQDFKEFLQAFANSVKLARTKMKMTQEEFAEFLNVSVDTLQRVESAKTKLRFETFYMIQSGLNTVSASEVSTLKIQLHDKICVLQETISEMEDLLNP